MKRTGDKSELYILFLAGIYNLIFVDVPIAGMPLRTLLLLLADFLCLAVYLYKGELALPRWKECRVYEKTMAVLIAASVAALAVSGFSGSDHFWAVADTVALLLAAPCVYGRKKFPQDIFCVYSACSCVTCILLLCHYLAGGMWEPFTALLLRNDAVVSWLVLGITMNMIAYCFEEKGQAWYGCNILLAAFLLAIQKNVPGMAVAGLVPLLFPIFCKPSKALAGRAIQAGFLYAFLLCNMSLITGYIPLLKGIATYDLEISVYMELLLAVMGVWFSGCWDRYARRADNDTALPQMRAWYRKAVTAYLAGITGILAASELFYEDDASAWKNAAQIIINDLRENPGWKAGLIGQMGQRFGVPGIAAACVLFYIGITHIYRTKHWRVKAHKLYRLVAAVCLLQALFLPQTMASLPVYAVFIFLFMETKEENG